MKVSIVIAAYNIEEYIERCLESIINQTLEEFEIIVVNDGSTDSTLEKIEYFSKKDERINIINQKNKGLIEARKSGLQKAIGDYILFVDGDDWLELETLEILYKKARVNESDVVVYNCFLSTDNTKEVFYIFKEEVIEKENTLKEIMLNNIRPSIWSKFIKHEFIKNNNISFPANISYAEDLATSITLFMNNPKITFESKALYNYYYRPESMTKKINNKILELDKAFNHIEKELKKENLYNQYKEEFEYLVYHHMMINGVFEKYYKNYKIGISLYNLYKKRSIDIYRNKYFLEKNEKATKISKFKTKMYNLSFTLGRSLDISSDLFKWILRRS